MITLLGVFLALVPLVVTMAAILVFRVKTHWAGLLGTMLTWIIAVGYSGTDPYLLPLAWIYGILAPISYFLEANCVHDGPHSRQHRDNRHP
jgi:L-lactate permease